MVNISKIYSLYIYIPTIELSLHPTATRPNLGPKGIKGIRIAEEARRGAPGRGARGARSTLDLAPWECPRCFIVIIMMINLFMDNNL